MQSDAIQSSTKKHFFYHGWEKQWTYVLTVFYLVFASIINAKSPTSPPFIRSQCKGLILHQRWRHVTQIYFEHFGLVGNAVQCQELCHEDASCKGALFIVNNILDVNVCTIVHSSDFSYCTDTPTRSVYGDDIALMLTCPTFATESKWTVEKLICPDQRYENALTRRMEVNCSGLIHFRIKEAVGKFFSYKDLIVADAEICAAACFDDPKCQVAGYVPVLQDMDDVDNRCLLIEEQVACDPTLPEWTIKTQLSVPVTLTCLACRGTAKRRVLTASPLETKVNVNVTTKTTLLAERPICDVIGYQVVLLDSKIKPIIPYHVTHAASVLDCVQQCYNDPRCHEATFLTLDSKRICLLSHKDENCIRHRSPYAYKVKEDMLIITCLVCKARALVYTIGSMVACVYHLLFCPICRVNRV